MLNMVSRLVLDSFEMDAGVRLRFSSWNQLRWCWIWTLAPPLLGARTPPANASVQTLLKCRCCQHASFTVCTCYRRRSHVDAPCSLALSLGKEHRRHGEADYLAVVASLRGPLCGFHRPEACPKTTIWPPSNLHAWLRSRSRSASLESTRAHTDPDDNRSLC